MERAEIEWDYPDPFILEVAVQEADIDSFGHVNNANYLRWLTECAWAHSAHVGLSESVCVALRRGMAVRTVQLDLLLATYLGDQLLVGNWLTAVTRLRATRVYQIVNVATGDTVLRGQVGFVCMNLDTGQATRMPPEFVAGYGDSACGDVDTG